MMFKEKDIHLMIDGLGIVFYSPETNKNIPEGYDFFGEEYEKPEDVVKHIKRAMQQVFVLELAEILHLNLEKATLKKNY